MEEWLYFKGAIDLAQLRFPKCRKKIKGLEWGAPLGVWGQVCIASMGKVKKLCMDVISSENTFIAVVFYRALRFEGI